MNQFKFVWGVDRGLRITWDRWGFAVFVEGVWKDRIGCRFRLGPVCVWWWITRVYIKVKPSHVDTGTPLLFGQAVGQKPLTSSLTGSTLFS